MRKEGRGVFKSHTESTEAQRYLVHRGELTLEGGHRAISNEELAISNGSESSESSEGTHTEGRQ